MNTMPAARRRWALAAAVVAVGLLLGWWTDAVQGAGVVGDGTAASCTEAAFDAALSGGGLVTFDCGPAPHVILLTYTKQIGVDTELDGGGLITLSGGNAVSHFQVYVDTTLVLRDVTLSRGNGSYGSIENFGMLQLTGSQVTLNNASGSGGGIQNYGTVVMQNAVVAGNVAASYGGGVYNDNGHLTIESSQIYSNTAQGQAGGGIWSNGWLTGTHSSLTGNRAAILGGGGIFNLGVLSLTEVTLENNEAVGGPSSGGGLSHSGGTATLAGVTFRGNRTDTSGGGLYIGGGSLVASEALFEHNEAYVGGAISNSGVFTLTHSLIYGNTAGEVGGVANGLFAVTGAVNRATLINVTVSHNRSVLNTAGGVQSNGGMTNLIFTTVANNVGGWGLGRGSAPGQLRLQNTIVAGNTARNCLDSVASGGFNISGDHSCLLTGNGDRNSTDPLLESLADNGGRTQTYLPQEGSAAIDGAQCVADIGTDQRGMPRPVGAACDVGAVEVAEADGPAWEVYLPFVAWRP